MAGVQWPLISVVIPTYNEAATIARTLQRLAGQGADEVVVVDAGSPDGTAARAGACGVRVVTAPRGRGVQQNRGAEAAAGDVLLFLHADCWLEAGAIAALRRFVGRNPRVPGGCFRMRVEAPGRAFRAIDAAAHLRAGVLGLPYGDQGIFIRRWAFVRAGGFPETRLMEDLLMARKLRRLGRLAVLSPRIFVSPRRWQQQGLVRQTLRNWALTAAEAVGVDTAVLARFYPIVR